MSGEPTTVNRQLLTINQQLATTNCHLSTVNRQLLTINYQPTTTNCHLSVTNHQLSTTNLYFCSSHQFIYYMQYPGFVLNNVLPSKKQVSYFIEALTQYLFPVTQELQVFLEAHEQTCSSLQTQLHQLLALVDRQATLPHYEIIDTYFNSLCSIKDKLLRDAKLILDFDPAASSLEEVISSYPGFLAITVHRLAHQLYLLHVPILPRMISEWAHSETGIDINPGATIGCPFFIDHGTGVVIGETAIIGNDVKIYQGVTLGALAVRKEDAARKRHPTVQDNVVIYAGSTILGGSTVIGHDSIIGGNTWLTHSIPAHSVVYHQHQTVIKDSKDFEEPINWVI